MELLANLNAEQKEAVQHKQGPLLVLAGAGSGKTRVLTSRIAYLIQEVGVDPHNILAVTFTNKAASEMQERIEELVTKDSRSIWMGTFHSIAVRILRREIAKLGYNSNFVIYDSSDQKTLIKNIIKDDLDLDTKQFKPYSVLSQISQAKNELQDVQSYQQQTGSYFEKVVGEAYQLYQEQLKENNALDFDDLIMKTVELFRNYELVLEYYQQRFHQIMVDEYQDVNHAQYVLVNLLAAKHQNIAVVGDDDQGIYGWRGADISNILNFEQDYEDIKVVKLEQNYRSTQNILDAAFAVVKNNCERRAKRLWTENEAGPPLVFKQALNERKEARYVVEEIKKKVNNEDYSYQDFALLYRTNAQSRVLEEVFVKSGIPYRIVGGLKFYDRQEVKDILAYLRVFYNPEDDISLQRIINRPKRGIGATTLGRVLDFAQAKQCSLYEAISRVEEIESISSGYGSRVRNFVELMDYLRQRSQEVDALQLTEELLKEIGYIRQLQEQNDPKSESRIENINELLAVIEEHVKDEGDSSLESFLEEVALIADIDTLEDKSAVVMMTLHSAKGLEFPVVFLTGMEEGIFPHSRCLDERESLEEERRLCYVGMTRAQKELYLTCAQSRKVYGNTSYNPPSRFIEEIPESLFNKQEEQQATSTADKAQHTGYTIGDQIKHNKWGIGKIVSVEDLGNDLKVAVAFPEQGIKQILASYAAMKKIN
ncbi:DNA helicase PcrA [Fuchsiella alkaliacetigena]|uniref:DNA helicase PcrA n=1 Tax=Fuchsiella alkaliacetigena TaxID=957042 RepID=UPI00200B4285|nr:DNA helicase PcrA [Fuchsiella alkaliacetigena]MCK8825461.1 DNA helicase PcrA [Fuchsiella alkaliacetigena]